MKVCLDLHDWSLARNRWKLLLGLKKRYPNFKISLFAIPVDKKNPLGEDLKSSVVLEEVKNNLDWVQIVPHGLYHNGAEMNGCDYFVFKEKIIPLIKEAFEINGLPFVNGFSAPHWRWSEGVVRVLDEIDWWGAVDRRQPRMITPHKYYRYSYCLDEPFSLDEEVLKLHGHVYGTSNDVGLCYENLTRIPKSAEWCFVSDFVETKN